MKSLSIIRAGLREAARVLPQVLNTKYANNHHKTQNLIIIITLGLVCKSHAGQRELGIWSESMTGKKDSHWRQKRPAYNSTSRKKH